MDAPSTNKTGAKGLPSLPNEILGNILEPIILDYYLDVVKTHDDARFHGSDDYKRDYGIPLTSLRLVNSKLIDALFTQGIT